VLGNSRKNMNRQAIRLGKADSDEVDAGLHQRRHEVHIAGKTIQLRDDQRRAMQAAQSQRFGELRPVGALAGFDFNDFADKPIDSAEIGADGLLLRFEAERSAALLGGAHAVIGEEALRELYRASRRSCVPSS
jgi:hypothetical protein